MPKNADREIWAPLADLIAAHDRFLISSHIRPDGDAIGSALAMRRLLERLGKDAVCVMDEDPGRLYASFFSSGEIQILDSRAPTLPNREVMVMVDAGEWYRLGRAGDLMRQHPGPKICIDHHLPQNEFHGLKIVDVHSPSTTVMIYRFLRYLDMELTFGLAEPIYLGLIVDTQNFHLPNTTEETHFIAAECLRAGVRPDQVHKPVYGTLRFARIRLLSQAFSNLEVFFQGKVGLMHTTRAMFEAYGADESDDDGFVDLVKAVEGVRVGVYLREEKDRTIKVSWRTLGENSVVESALRFGGGGHKQAAGATVAGDITSVKQLVLTDLEQRIVRGEIT
ncbi:MAG: bifunctional oligoribonuclease/PAP phosphatase NrnA [bacterium]